MVTATAGRPGTDRTRAMQQQAVQLHRAGRLEEAAALYRRILQQGTRDPDAMHLLGVVHFQQRAFRKAEALIRRALADRPDDATVHHNLASTLRVLGRFKDAETHYRAAIRLKADYADAYFNLSAVRKFTEEDPVLAPLAAQLRRPDLGRADRCLLHFAAGKIHDDLGRYDEAFGHYRAGNVAQGASFDPDAHEGGITEQIATFTPRFFDAHGGDGLADAAPLFIVGMPRCGSTLVEQILASHPAVFGAGEQTLMQAIVNTLPDHAGGTPYPTCMRRLPPHALRGFAGTYLKHIRALHPTASRIVDKLPHNYLHVGLIAVLLPRARVIHCRRDPLDTCLSCYFQRFRQGQEFTYDLTHLGRYYRQYERLMAHWHGALPGRLFELDYEKLVADPQGISRELLEFCGLAWHPDCLQSHRNPRQVTTASNWQVRCPIYRSSVQRWRRYERHIEPLQAALRKG